MNQIIPSSALKLGKGGDALKTFTYYGESGKSDPLHVTLATAEHVVDSPRGVFNVLKIALIAETRLGKPVHCYYCPNCTIHVYHHQTIMGDKSTLR